MCFVGDFIAEYRNDAGARPWDRRRPLIVGEAARQRAYGIVRFKTSPWPEAGRSLKVAAMRASATILTQNQPFPTARPDFVQQNGDHRARERSFSIDARWRSVGKLLVRTSRPQPITPLSAVCSVSIRNLLGRPVRLHRNSISAVPARVQVNLLAQEGSSRLSAF